MLRILELRILGLRIVVFAISAYTPSTRSKLLFFWTSYTISEFEVKPVSAFMLFKPPLKVRSGEVVKDEQC